MKKFNQQGSSLIMIMVLCAVVGVIGAAIATSITNSNREAQSVGARDEFNGLVNSLQGSLLSQQNCINLVGGSLAFALPNVTPVNLPALNLAGSRVSLGRYGKSLNINAIQVVKKLAPRPAVANQWYASLRLRADRSSGNREAVGGSPFNQSFDLIVTLNAANSITTCSGIYTDFWINGNISTQTAYMGGRVGIGIFPKSTNPAIPDDTPAEMLDVRGKMEAKIFLDKSDANLKKNIRPIADSARRLLRLRGVLFDWKSMHGQANESRNNLGFIAQEVEKEFPEAVTTNPETNLKSISYEKLVAPMIDTIKYHQKLLKDQQLEIRRLSAELESLQAIEND